MKSSNMRTLRKNTSLVAGLLLTLCAAASHAADRIVTVFAASSLTDVLEEVGKAYTDDTHASPYASLMRRAPRWRDRSNPAHRPRPSSPPTRTG